LSASQKGHRELFNGFWIDGSDYDLTPHPVIRLTMDETAHDSPKSVNDDLLALLKKMARDENLELLAASPRLYFRRSSSA
jgi:hypothetical protein